METNEILLDESMPVADVDSGDYAANLYSSGVSYDTTATSYGMGSTHLFVWITLTMMWVLMILAIMALLKYVTHEERKPRAKGK